jgi:glycogen debranching enzyme
MYILSYQLERGPRAGFVQISANLDSRPQYKESNIANSVGLIDYKDLYLTGVGEYFRYTGNAHALSPYWERIRKLAAAISAFIDPVPGLVAGSPQVPNAFSLLGPLSESATTGLFAYMLDKISPLAHTFGDEEASTLYSQTATRSREALNRELWNDKLGVYSLSTASSGNLSLTGIA